jgi:hypothetical protein
MHIQKKLVPFVVFFIVANPATFKAVRGIAGNWVASAEGIPTTAGLLLHALVFVLVAHFVWRLIFGSKKSGYGATTGGLGDDKMMYGKNRARAVEGLTMHPAEFSESDE